MNSFHDLARRFDGVAAPPVDVDALVAQGEQRLHRRRMAAVLATVVVLAAVAVGGVVAGSAQHQQSRVADRRADQDAQGSADRGAARITPACLRRRHRRCTWVTRPSRRGNPSRSSTPPMTAPSTRPRSTARCGSPTAHSTSVIGTSELTAAPTAHAGVVTTGDSGSLVVWGDVAGRKNQIPSEFVVYDTSRREEVARIPFTERGRWDSVVYVDENQVYFNPDPSTPGCWAVDVNDIHPCKDPHLFRFDVASGHVRRGSWTPRWAGRPGCSRPSVRTVTSLRRRRVLPADRQATGHRHLRWRPSDADSHERRGGPAEAAERFHSARGED